MRIVLSVSSSSQYCEGGCEFALLDLAALALTRVGGLKEQKRLDPFIDETYYGDNSVQYLSPWTSQATARIKLKGEA